MLPAARELSKHGVRVNTINPGLFGTPTGDGGVIATEQDVGH